MRTIPSFTYERGAMVSYNRRAEFIVFVFLVTLFLTFRDGGGTSSITPRTSEAPWAQQEQDEHEEAPTVVEADDLWTSGSISELYKALACSEVHHNPENPDSFPIHDDATWKFLRDTYRDVVGEEESSLPPPTIEQEEGTASGFLVAFQIRNTEKAGRSVFADQDISQGTLVWESKFTAKFHRGSDYRSFLKRISPALACDVLDWAYTLVNPKDEDDIVVCVYLEPSSFTNSCDTDEECNHDWQLGTSPPSSTTTTSNNSGYHEVHATRDISVGEELRMDYGIFADPFECWVKMGLLYRHEFREDGDDDDDGYDEDEEYDEYDEDDGAEL